MLQFEASLTDDTRSVNYDRDTFIIQATGANVIKLFMIIVMMIISDTTIRSITNN